MSSLVALKVLLKIETFDYSRPEKDEIWQNPTILGHVENMA